MERKKIVILGAGLSGLAAAEKLAKDFDVLVIESEKQTGGLAKTIKFNGHLLDFGPHPIYATEPKNEPLMENLRKEMGKNVFEIERNSGVWFNNKLLRYPLKMRDILSKLPVLELFHYGLDFAKARALFFISRGNEKDFESWVISRYGKKIYSLYFEKYTEKAWGLSPKFLASAFAAERVPETSFWEAAVEAITGKKPSSSIDHPHNPQRAKSFFARFGVGMLPNYFEKKALKKGAMILCGQRAVGLKLGRKKILGVFTEKGKKRSFFPCDFLVSTIPLPELVSFLVPERKAKNFFSALPFSSLVLVFLFFKKEMIFDQKWIYFPEQTVSFNRAFEIKNCSKDCAPAGQTSVCLEFSSFVGSSLWKKPEKELFDIALSELSALGFVEKKDCFDFLVVRVPNAYCLWKKGFERKLDEANSIVSAFENIRCLGRQAEFKYYNMDHCLSRSFLVADSIKKFFGFGNGKPH